MQFKNLKDIDLSYLLSIINDSFADYIVPMHISMDKFELKIQSEQIDLSISVGAFHNNELVGFILHGSKNINGELHAYNAITGVLPAHRKQKLTVKMYNFILPHLKELGYTQIQLEAITNNVPALKSYIESGFSITRILECYKGKVKQLHSVMDENITIQKNWDGNVNSYIWDWEPTWQNDITSISNVKENVTCINYKVDNEIVGYLLFNNITYRVQQFAVAREYRNQHIASKLFNALTHHTGDKEIQLINIQAEVSGSKFLNRIGFELFLKQYEMVLTLK
jgi:ribosomal protein S18 acetylase RimI-like enzyme